MQMTENADHTWEKFCCHGLISLFYFRNKLPVLAAVLCSHSHIPALSVVEQEDLDCPWICGAGLKLCAKLNQRLLKAQHCAVVQPKQGQAGPTCGSGAQIPSQCSGNGAGAVPWAVWGAGWSPCEPRLGWPSCPQEQHWSPPRPSGGFALPVMWDFCCFTGVLGRSPSVELVTGRSCRGRGCQMISFVTAAVQIPPRNQNPFPHPGLPGGSRAQTQNSSCCQRWILQVPAFFCFLTSN